MPTTDVQLGRPDLTISGLRIWVHGRQYPDRADYWDGNWLEVTAHCGAEGSSVNVTGSIIHVPELARFKDDLELFVVDPIKGKMELQTMEPELKIEFEANAETSRKYGGLIMAKVSITPNHLLQVHRFIFEVNRSNLQECITQLKAILLRYPTIGTP